MPTPLPSSAISKKIKELREQRFKNQAAFVRALGAPQPLVSRWENAGDAHTFDPETLERVAAALGVPSEVFYMPGDVSGVTPAELADLRRMLEGVVSQASAALDVVRRALGDTQSPASGELAGLDDEPKVRLATAEETAQGMLAGPPRPDSPADGRRRA